MPKPISDSDFDTDVLKSSLPVVLDFWAPWCGPCKVMLPVLEELAKDLEGKVTFMKMNVDENPETPGKFNVMGIPTFVIFKGGELVGQVVGSKSKEDMRAIIDKAIA